MPVGKIRGDQIKDDSITEADIDDEAIKHFVYGSVDLNTNYKPANWVNASTVSSSIGIKTWFIVPFTCKIDKVIVTVKGNNFDQASDGDVSVYGFLNQPNYDTRVFQQTAAASTFTQKVSNMNNGTVDCNQKIFSGINTQLTEGDMLQIKVGKTAGDEREAIVTVVFT